MADILQEVDDAMRQERMMQFWNENKFYIIGFVLGTIILTGLISGYRSWDAHVKEEQTAKLVALQEAADYPENILQLEDLDMRANMRGITLLQAAGVFVDEEKFDEAIVLAKRAAEDKAISDDLRHLAIIMYVRLASNQDDADAKPLIDALDPVVSASKSPWHANGLILSAAIHANLLQDYDTAIEYLNTVQDLDNLPQSLSERARALGQLYTIRQQEAAAES